MTILEHAQTMIGYKSWADQITWQAITLLPDSELNKQRQTCFGTILSTLNHIYVVDDIFKAHLTGTAHGYSARNTPTSPPPFQLRQSQQEMNHWYQQYVDGLDDARLGEVVEFTFVGGGEGVMTRNEILHHLVNHGSYHRGFVSDMMYQIPAIPPANDLPVYLRDVVHAKTDRL